MRAAVVGIGNGLMKDDGVGIHVVRALADVALPEGTEVIDAGTSCETAFDVAGFDRLILIDAVRGGGAPGTIYRFPGDTEVDEGTGCRAGHDVRLLETLRLAAHPGGGPDLYIVGVEPEEIDWGLDLSPAVRGAVPRVVEIVQQELRRDRCS
jgi:hydrogenase maturation protease